MPQATTIDLNDYIVPLNMNGLQGRMLRLPARANKKREMLLVYSQFSTLEQWAPLAQELTRYGRVTMPDLPGFGGMASLYKIGAKPTVDALADYLAAFVKLRYKRFQPTIIGIGFGFVVVTRMLQRYPELTKRVDLLISIGGFTHFEDFSFKEQPIGAYKFLLWFGSCRLPALVVKLGNVDMPLRAWWLPAEFKHLQGTGTSLKRRDWQASDVRTHMATSLAILRLDNCQRHIDLPVWHVALEPSDKRNEHIIKQHMHVIFTDVQQERMTPKKRKTKKSKEMSPEVLQFKLLTPKLRQVLAKS